MNPTGAPSPRSSHTAVWTGTEMILWGGYDNNSYLNDGGRYDPTADNWAAVTSTGAPVGRLYHTAVWTGTEMIVWGGSDSADYTDDNSYLNDGGRYNPLANTWTPVTTTGAPARRDNHAAVWTGNSMIIWGGSDYANSFDDTFIYTPGRLLYLYQRP